MAEENKRFKRAFAPNPAPRYDDESIKKIADEIVYVCPGPIFDNVADDPKALQMFRDFIDKAVKDYDPNHDVILDYGDPWILCMMIYAMPELKLNVGRFNKRTDDYSVMSISPWWDVNETDMEMKS